MPIAKNAYFAEWFKWTCWNCGGRFFAEGLSTLHRLERCPDKKCDSVLSLEIPERHLTLPESVLCGADHDNLLELQQLAPNLYGEDQGPYSTQSFVMQASQHWGACKFLGHDYNKGFHCGKNNASSVPCHIFKGFGNGGTKECLLWAFIEKLCQTDQERWFMTQYMRYVRDRVFPMPLPQVRLGGITQELRPDFLLFIPRSKMNFISVAVELDGGHTAGARERDEERHLKLQSEGFRVVSYRGRRTDTEGRGPINYIDDIKDLVSRIDRQMDLTKENSQWSNALAIDAHPF
jgi:hypothetical protein